jgi:hypothetical protein
MNLSLSRKQQSTQGAKKLYYKEKSWKKPEVSSGIVTYNQILHN